MEILNTLPIENTEQIDRIQARLEAARIPFRRSNRDGSVVFEVEAGYLYRASGVLARNGGKTDSQKE